MIFEKKKKKKSFSQSMDPTDLDKKKKVLFSPQEKKKIECHAGL